MNKLKKNAKGTYVGPTLLSDLVEFKAKEIREDICLLLKDAPAEGSGELDVWKPLRSILPQCYATEANELIVTLVLYQLADWDMRVMESLTKFSCRLMLMLRAPPAEDCPLRREVSGSLLDSFDCCVGFGSMIRCYCFD